MLADPITHLTHQLVALEQEHERVDRRISVMLELAKALLVQDILRSLDLAQRACALSEHLPNRDRHPLRLDALVTLTRAHISSGQHDQALQYALCAMPFIEQGNGAIEDHCLLYDQLAFIHLHRGLYDKGIEYLGLALQLSEDHQLPDVQATVLRHIGLWYVYLHMWDKAIASHHTALRLHERYPLPLVGRSVIYNNLALCYLRVGRAGEAMSYAHSALALARQAETKRHEAVALTTVAEVYSTQGAEEIALNLLDEAEPKLEAVGLHHRMWELTYLRAQIWGRQGYPAQAAAHLQTVYPQLIGKLNHQHKCAAALADLYNDAEDYRQAAYYYKEAGLLYQRLHSEKMQERISLLEVLHQTAQAKHEAEAVRQDLLQSQAANSDLERLIHVRTRDLEAAQVEMLERMAVMGEKRHTETGEHNRRVGDLSARIAAAMGVDEEQVEILRLAARLHDIGKVGIPDCILLKPGRLDPAEYIQMQEHTVIGAQILADGNSPYIRMAEEIARSHHERWDGLGYPHGLKGTEIPLVGRIVAVVDQFDALVHQRLYKRAWPEAEAIREIRRQAGTSFEPAVVAAFLRVMEVAD